MAKKYSKLNFVDAVKIVTPDLYLEDDLALSGSQVKLTDLIINSHLASINKIAQTLNISALSESNTLSAINTPSGFSQYFVKQNKLTDITSNDFQQNILTPLGYKYSDYGTSSEFLTFLSGTLLPKITLNSSTLLSDTSANYATTTSGTHAYLISNLSWLYFLNTSGPVSSPSSLIASSIVKNLYKNTTYLINDGIKDYQEYLWTNFSNFSSLDAKMLPGSFQSGTGSYTSGTQNLDKLKTLIDVIYSPLYIDREDEVVKNAIEAGLGSSNYELQSTEPKGPFHKFLRGLSYSLRDIDNQVESLETLGSIENCPPEYLPYLASLLGWKLYGNNPASWRNQIRNAASLYRKKGTKQGLIDALDTIIVNNPIDVSGAISEMFESYIPQLLYYLLITETDMFNPKTYSIDTAISYGIDPQTYSSNNKDQNIRAAVDSIISNAVEAYPYLFFIRNEPFRLNITEDGRGWLGPIVNWEGTWYTGEYYSKLYSKKLAIKGDDNFRFHYRGRTTPVPPWDDEKFFRNCAVTDELLHFYKSELERFCIDVNFTNSFYDYTNNYILSGNDRTDLYLDNGYVFFTSSVQLPPNYDSIIDNKVYQDYDALSLWNGKSSTFDFTVCSGDFSSILFQDSSGQYSNAEILQSLSIMDDFVPAKAIPRTRVVLKAAEYASGIDYICPSIIVPRKDVGEVGARGQDVCGVSGMLNNFSASGIYDRITGFALGEEKYNGFDDSQSTIEHAKLPVFTREQAKYSNNIVSSVVNTIEIVPPTATNIGQPVKRKSLRRRDFHNTLEQKGWFDRGGRNMPTFYNNTSSILDFLPLGWNPSSFGLVPATPENLSGVYSKDCAGSASNDSYFNLNVSSAFLSRNYDSLAFSSCDQFVRRDTLPEEIYTLFKFHELKKEGIADETYKLNYNLFSASSIWKDVPRSFANMIEDVGFDKYLSPKLDKREFSLRRRNANGIHTIYNTYNKYFLSALDGSSLPENQLVTVKQGGPTILSHTYGPIYYNSDFSIDGSAIDPEILLPDSTPATNLITTKIQNPFYIQLNVSGAALLDGEVGVSSVQNANTPYYGNPEFVASHFLSGISFIDTSSSDRLNLGSIATDFAILNFDSDQKTVNSTFDNYLIKNPCVYMRTRGAGLPRIKFDLSGYTEMEKNILIPDHDFELTVNFFTGKLDSSILGGGSIGAVLRTKVEKTNNGDSVVFFWAPNGEWKMEKVSNINNAASGISNILNNYTHTFLGKEETNIQIQDTQCDVISDNNTLLRYITEEDKQSVKLKFHTKNQKTPVPFEYGTYYNADSSLSSIYNGRHVQLHRANIFDSDLSQDYILELFQYPNLNSEKRFVVFDDISLVDKTLNDAAQVPYEAVIPDLTLQQDAPQEIELRMPDGSPLALTKSSTTVGTDIAGDLTYDLFRTSVGDLPNILAVCENPGGDCGPMSYASELWTVIGAPDWNSYRNPNSGEFFPGGAILNFYSEHGDDVGDDGLMGKIPYTGICNSTMTKWPSGFGENHAPGGANDGDLHTAYWVARKGFHSYNQWSDYIPQGKREEISQNPTSLGFGGGLAVWPYFHTHQRGSLLGSPLLALARPGHSCIEQHMVSTPKTFLELNTLLPGNTNPLGYSKEDDRFFYSDLENYTGNNPFSGWIVGFSIGEPIEIDFTSKRVKPTITESDNVFLDIDALGDEDNWEYVPAGVDPLLPTVLDPTGMVGAARSFFQLQAGRSRAHPNTNVWGVSDEQYNSFSEAGGITFPPLSVYRDVERNKLIQGQPYSFCVYLRGKAKGDESFQDNYATSAMVTIAPIGSNNSYTRLVLKLGEPVASPYWGAGAYTSSILTNGHSYTGDDAASVEEIVVPWTTLYPNADKVSWYKVRVTIPYDAFEMNAGNATLGIDAVQNKGLRCFVQAYNDRFDGLLPEDLPVGNNQREAILHTPCKLLTWGYGLYAATRAGDFRRYEQSRVFRLGHNQLNPTPSNNGGNAATGEIANVISYDSAQTNMLTIYENEEVLVGRKLYKDSNDEVYTYEKDLSSLKKLTLVKSSAPYSVFKANLYKGIKFYDNSGLEYSGPINFSLGKRILRPENFSQEPESARVLTLSGSIEGTNIGKSVKGYKSIEPIDLLHLFRYFNKLGKAATRKGFNTRVWSDSSAVHCASGGSRLSYRNHPDPVGTGEDGTYGNYTQLEVDN